MQTRSLFMNHSSRPLLLVLAAAILAPCGAFAGGTISNGSASLQFVGLPAFSSGFGDVTLSFSGSPAIPDQQSRLTWYYRTPASNINSLFSNVDTPSESYSGNSATIAYTNAGPGPTGGSRFNATFVFTLTSTAPGMAQVDTTLTFTSLASNTTTQTFNLFNVIGFDLGANGVADTYHMTDPNAVSGTISDTGASGYFVNFRETGASRYELNASGSALNSKLTSGAQDLASAAGSTAPDVSSAIGAAGFQWSVTLAPGQSTTIRTSYALNQAIAVPEPSTWTLVALGCAGALACRYRSRRRATLA